MLKVKNIFKIYGLILFILIACTLKSCSGKRTPSQLKGTIGIEAVNLIAKSKHVSVARAVKDDSKQFVMAPVQHVLTPDAIEKLKALLLQDAHYIFDRTKRCVFAPEVAFRFENSDELILMMNLFCNQAKFIMRGRSVIIDYDPMSEELNEFCREILDKLDHKATLRNRAQ